MKNVLLIAAVFALVGATSQAEEENPLEIRIANVGGLVGVGEEILESQLHVVVTNRSKADIRIYDQWNSWGYGSLTFTVEFANGNKLNLHRFGGTQWTANSKGEITLRSGEQYVYAVWLKPEDNQNFTNSWGPLQIRNGYFPDVTLKAHHPGGRFLDGTATGAVSSVPMKFRLKDEWNPRRHE